MEYVDTTILNTAVPTIANSFNISPVILKFSVASYFLSLAIFIPISGWCTDRYGTKKMFMFSVALFIIASLLCALSHNIWQLTIFRFIQGIGGAFMNPVSRIIIVRLFPPKDLVRVQGVIFTPAMLGFALGPVLGGFLTSYLSWHWIFYINIPFGLLALHLGNKYIQQYVPSSQKGFDLIGFVIAAAALCLITIFVETLYHYEILTESQVFLCGIIGVALFLLLVLYCLNTTKPVFDFTLLKIKTFRIGFCVNLCFYAINASVSFLLPLMFQESFHYSPVRSGVLILPMAIGYVTARFFASKIINFLGFKKALCTGISLVTLWLVMLGNIHSATSLNLIYIIEFALGVSTVIVGASTGALNYIDVAKKKMSDATAIDLTFRQFASSFGIGLSGFCLTTFSALLSVNMFSLEAEVFHCTFYVLAFLAFIGLLIGLKLKVTDGAHALKAKKNA